MAKKAEKAEKAPKKAKGKGRRGKGSDPEGANAALSVAAHPRARAQVRRAKGLGGLVGFALALLFSLQAGVPADLAAERALVAGMAGLLLAWACGVTVWRQLLLAELGIAAERARARREEAATAPGVLATASGPSPVRAE